uniref:FBD domain-containing protein n=1 Tax=Nelumbo nucifera TaxID=4432 RepID=A0A822XLD4_NELNU|nr:TPA_asm: hypothetical protein HUJ06_022265 [Nelumbo nucifera]
MKNPPALSINQVVTVYLLPPPQLSPYQTPSKLSFRLRPSPSPGCSSAGMHTDHYTQEMAENVDRISDLIDPILVLVLSSLPSKHAVRTSVLSKRWRHLWAEIPYLDFEESLFIDNQIPPPPCITSLPWLMHVRNEGRRRFVAFVHRMLLLYKGKTIFRFRLRFCYDGEHVNNITQWIGFAIAKQVQELDLDFSGAGLAQDSRTGYRRYELPNYLFCYTSCSVLKLNFCQFKPFSFKIFSLLRMLSLIRIELSSELLLRVLTNCSVLETLHLEKCHGLSHLKISDSNLRLESLRIHDCRPLSQGVDICAPKLRSFKYFGHIVRFGPEKMLSLHEVSLDFGLQTLLYDQDQKLGKLLLHLDHVRVMSVCSYLIQVLPAEGQCLPTPLCNLRHLTLNTMLDNHELPGISFLLRSSPKLQSLSIELGLGREIKGYNPPRMDMSLVGGDYWQSEEQPFGCILNHLEFVRINWFTGAENEISLARYIVKNAMALKKMIIHICQDSTLDEINSMTSRLSREILDCPKASPVAELLIN